MDEVASRAIGAVAKVVEGSAVLCLVLGVAVHSSQLCLSMSKLALAAILAAARFLEATAQLSLVAVRRQQRRDLGREGRRWREARWGRHGSYRA